MEFIKIVGVFLLGLFVGVKCGAQIQYIDYSNMTDEEIEEFERRWEERL